jgi:enoyl-CoA hydratase/carnithine racemase
MAFGLAIDIASACDIRLAASNSVFGIMVRLLFLYVSAGD